MKLKVVLMRINKSEWLILLFLKILKSGMSINLSPFDKIKIY